MPRPRRAAEGGLIYHALKSIAGRARSWFIDTNLCGTVKSVGSSWDRTRAKCSVGRRRHAFLGAIPKMIRCPSRSFLAALHPTLTLKVSDFHQVGDAATIKTALGKRRVCVLRTSLSGAYITYRLLLGGPRATAQFLDSSADVSPFSGIPSPASVCRLGYSLPRWSGAQGSAAPRGHEWR